MNDPAIFGMLGKPARFILVTLTVAACVIVASKGPWASGLVGLLIGGAGVWMCMARRSRVLKLATPKSAHVGKKMAAILKGERL